MRRRFMGAMLAGVAMLAFLPGLQAQTAPASGGIKTIPDLSGLWEGQAGIGAARTGASGRCLAIASVCAAFLGLAPPERPKENLDEPRMLPWAEKQYNAVREGLTDPNGNPSQERVPSWGGCMPQGPTELLRGRAFELRQFPDVVLLLFDRDHAVRRIYMDGRGHPKDLKPTWNGHSIGSYEGDTLVVDTVGINDKSWLDAQGHPHTDALHVVERLRRLNQDTLEVEFTFDDPKAYEKAWKKKVVHRLREPGPEVWDGAECDELLQLGTHYSAESKK